MPLYKHILKPQDLKESKNEWVQYYYNKFPAEGGKGEPITDGMQQLETDAPRSIMIKGKLPDLEELKEKKLTFKDHIENELGIECITAINKSYHQDLSTATINPLTSHPVMDNLKLQARGRASELYTTNGNVFLKTTVQAYKISEEEGIEIVDRGFLASPIEVLYKLDKDKGFVLQHVATDSDLVRDAYLGKPINKEKTLLPELHETLELAMQHHKNKMEDYKLEQSFESIKKIENLLKTQLGQPEYKDYIDDALLTIALIKSNKMSLQTSQEKFKHLADHVKKHAPTQQFSLFDRMRGKKSVAEVLNEASKLLDQLNPDLYKQASNPQLEEKAPAPTPPRL